MKDPQKNAGDSAAEQAARAAADAAAEAAANAAAEASADDASAAVKDPAGDAAADSAPTADSAANADTADAATADAAEETVEDKLLAHVQELTADLQRVSAEFANYRKRVSRDISTASHNGKADVLAALLPITDDVERARQHGDLESNTALKAFCEKFLNVLQSHEVEEFGAVGEPFDANTHEAIQDEGGDGDKVISTVLRKGYRLGDRVLRSALVIVAGDEGVAAAAGDDSAASDAAAEDDSAASDAGADGNSSEQ